MVAPGVQGRGSLFAVNRGSWRCWRGSVCVCVKLRAAGCSLLRSPSSVCVWTKSSGRKRKIHIMLKLFPSILITSKQVLIFKTSVIAELAILTTSWGDVLRIKLDNSRKC